VALAGEAIFPFLDLRSHLRLRCTPKTLRDNSRNPKAWDKDISVTTCGTLESLSVSGDAALVTGLGVFAHIFDVDMSRLPNFRQLRTFKMHHLTSVTDDGLAYLEGLPLTCLSLYSFDITDAGMVHLSDMASLVTLQLACSVSTLGISHLRHLSVLCMCGSYPMLDEGLANLSPCSLDYLCIDASEVTDRGLGSLVSHPLVLLDLRESTKITGLGLVTFKQMPHLRTLSMTADNVPIHELHILDSLDLDQLNLIGARGILTNPARAIQICRQDRVGQPDECKHRWIYRYTYW
jgi:hypothetical protein